MGDETCKCCNCGYEWKRGQDGQHSCSSVLRAEVERLRAEVAEKQANYEDCRGECNRAEERVGLLESYAGCAINIILNQVDMAKPEWCFVEIENDYGKSVKVGEWSPRDGGYDGVRITVEDIIKTLDNRHTQA